ncbi:molybdopterin molybdenumtransferase MoeA [Candidatus Bathyarchaeota archaeon]|nr:MAG: molybdopterin molybdenumtransferase MoeA [Candidatus Bathyarchaeota archaeon]
MERVRMRGFRRTVKVEDALRAFRRALPDKRLETEIIPVRVALNRVLAENVTADRDIPPFDRAAMDGFAVRAEDTFGASQTNPVILKVVGESKVGATPEVEVRDGEAVEIMTGAPMPRGADAVVMVEYTNKLDGGGIEILHPVAPLENVSRRGEDIKRGETVLRRGTILKPQDLGILASLGRVKVEVYKRPRVAIISTGDELVEPGVRVELGKVVDVNRVILSAMVEELGGVPIDIGIVRDDPDEIEKAIRRGLEEADLVIVTGGTSVGRADMVPEVIDSIGKPGMVVHGVSMRPGTPTGLAILDGKPVFSLSGYPVAAMMGFNIFVKPVISWMLGASSLPAPTVRARLTRRVASPPGVLSLVRVKIRKVGGVYMAEPIRSTGSGVISSMTRANGLLVIPEESEGVEAGEEVEVILLRPVGEV